MNKRYLRYATELLSLPTAPFSEHAVTRWVEAFVARRPVLSLTRDQWGNLLIRYSGSRRTRKIVFAAHMDHPGFTAIDLNRKGFLECRWSGGVPIDLFPGAHVRFFSSGKWIKGVVHSAAPHPKLSAIRDVLVRARGPVAPGSVGMWDFPDPRVRGNRLYARGCDDVAGVASLIALLDEAVHRKLKREFHVLLTRAEEAGLFGATGACLDNFLPKGSVVISVETSKELPGAVQGNGPIVRVGDRAGVFTPEACASLFAVARDLKKRRPSFQFQRKLMDGGVTESSIYAEYGFETGALALALRNYHNVVPSGRKLAAECIDLRDFQDLIRLELAVVESFARYGATRARFRRQCETHFQTHKHLLKAPSPEN